MAPPAEEQAQASAVASNGAAALAPEQKVNGTTEYGRLMAATVQEFVTHEIASAESRILGHIDATFGKFDTRLSLVERHVEQLRLRCASTDWSIFLDSINRRMLKPRRKRNCRDRCGNHYRSTEAVRANEPAAGESPVGLLSSEVAPPATQKPCFRHSEARHSLESGTTPTGSCSHDHSRVGYS